MTFEQYLERWKELSELQREWVKHKCNWEQMTRWAVLNSYVIPTDEELRPMLRAEKKRRARRDK